MYLTRRTDQARRRNRRAAVGAPRASSEIGASNKLAQDDNDGDDDGCPCYQILTKSACGGKNTTVAVLETASMDVVSALRCGKWGVRTVRQWTS